MAKTLCRLVLLCTLLIQLSGCGLLLLGAGATGGAGTILWTKGKLVEIYESPVTQVHAATIETLRELELPILKDKKDSLTAVVKSEFADGKSVKILIKSMEGALTKIKIRVGIFGDESRSRIILHAIRNNLL